MVKQKNSKKKEKQVQTSLQCMNSCRRHNQSKPFHKQLCISASSSPSSDIAAEDVEGEITYEEQVQDKFISPKVNREENDMAVEQESLSHVPDENNQLADDKDGADNTGEQSLQPMSPSDHSTPSSVPSTPSTSASSSVSHNSESTVIDVSKEQDDESKESDSNSSVSDRSENHTPEQIVTVVQIESGLASDDLEDSREDREKPSVVVPKCAVCHHKYKDPRLLPCLHSFCMECLERIEPVLNSSGKSRCEGVKHPSGGLGLHQLRPHMMSSPKIVRTGRKTILCPQCDTEIELPRSGASGLPRNYIMCHKLRDDTNTARVVMCDLCVDSAEARSVCFECSLNLCDFCCEAHKRQKRTGDHAVKPLDGSQLSSLVRSVKCLSHPREEVCMFCETCDRTICRDCGVTDHKDHKVAYINSISERHIAVIKNLLLQTKPHLGLLKIALTKLTDVGHKIYERSKDVETVINKFMDGYERALLKHRENLLLKVSAVKDGKENALKVHGILLEQMLHDLQHSCEVTEELLAQGSPAEILSLKRSVVRRLRDLNRMRYPTEPLVDAHIRFLPDKDAAKGAVATVMVDGYEVEGVVTCKRLSPKLSTLKTDGLELVYREHQSMSLLLHTMDTDGHPYLYGGEKISAQLFSTDNMQRSANVHVYDNSNGTYRLECRLDFSGQYVMYVMIHGQHVMGSPFTLTVLPSSGPPYAYYQYAVGGVIRAPPHHKPPNTSTSTTHSGVFHCCTFCSSGGRKDAECACGGTMPGEYRGCGHGHTGHPGRRHWSCCGRTGEHSVCSLEPLHATGNTNNNSVRVSSGRNQDQHAKQQTHHKHVPHHNVHEHTYNHHQQQHHQQKQHHHQEQQQQSGPQYLPPQTHPHSAPQPQYLHAQPRSSQQYHYQQQQQHASLQPHQPVSTLHTNHNSIQVYGQLIQRGGVPATTYKQITL